MIQEDLELNKLKLHINNLLKKDIYKNKVIECCPICGGKNYIKYGSYKEIQRYKCKECEKTFSNTTNSLWVHSKKDADKWIEFIELMLERRSLRYCAEKLNISLVTAFYWRHKVMRGLSINYTPNKLTGIVHLGKTMIKENFKGNRNITTSRRENIWVIGAKGSEDSMLIKPTLYYFWDLKIFNEKIYYKIDKKAYIIPNNDRYLTLVAKSHNKKLSINDKELKKDDRIRYLMLNLENWLKKFCGIATKYLEEYLSFFILFNLDRSIGYMDMIKNLFIENVFVRTNEIRLVRDVRNFKEEF